MTCQIDGGNVAVEESMAEFEESPLLEEAGWAVFDLVSVVAHIHDPACQNLVALIKVSTVIGYHHRRHHLHQIPSSYHVAREGIDRTSWHLFNDFAVSPTTGHEAVHYNPAWKVNSIASSSSHVSHHTSDPLRHVLCSPQQCSEGGR